jgi:hypothetical protein
MKNIFALKLNSCCLKKIKKTVSFLMLTSFACSLTPYAGPAEYNLSEDAF